jgi:hypothetical protein
MLCLESTTVRKVKFRKKLRYVAFERTRALADLLPDCVVAQSIRDKGFENSLRTRSESDVQKYSFRFSNRTQRTLHSNWRLLLHACRQVTQLSAFGDITAFLQKQRFAFPDHVLCAVRTTIT